MNGKKAKLLRAVAGYKKAVEPPCEYPFTSSWSPERGAHPVQLTAKYEKTHTASLYKTLKKHYPKSRDKAYAGMRASDV